MTRLMQFGGAAAMKRYSDTPSLIRPNGLIERLGGELDAGEVFTPYAPQSCELPTSGVAQQERRVQRRPGPERFVGHLVDMRA
jgi:hypothetical protein